LPSVISGLGVLYNVYALLQL